MKLFKLQFIVVLLLFPVLLFAQEKKWIPEGWLLFNQVTFRPKYFKEYDETFLVPEFPQRVKAKVNTEISLSGYYMPMKLDGNRVILSKYPYSACFFCGGAGPESVVEINLTEKKPKLRTDQVISVKGKLRLNDSDVDHMTFILYDAIILE